MANNAKHPKITLLLTRPLDGARAFLDALPPDVTTQITPIFSPLIKITELQTPLPTADIMIFTSATSVAFAGQGNGRTAFCVGTATTLKAEQQGWAAKECGQTANALVANVIRKRPTAPMLHLGGVHTRGEIADRLTAAGLPTRHVALYDQTLCKLTTEAQMALHRETPAIVPLFSPRTAGQFARQLIGSTPLHIVALSAAVAEQLGEITVQNLTICAAPTRRAMVEAVKNQVNALTLG